MAEPPIVFPDTPKAQHVCIVEIDLAFGSILALLLKVALAAIPALLILGLLGAMLAGLLGIG